MLSQMPQLRLGQRKLYGSAFGVVDCKFQGSMILSQLVRAETPEQLGKLLGIAEVHHAGRKPNRRAVGRSLARVLSPIDIATRRRVLARSFGRLLEGSDAPHHN